MPAVEKSKSLIDQNPIKICYNTVASKSCDYIFIRRVYYD